MTRIFLATFENVLREQTPMRQYPDSSVLFAIRTMRSLCHAATVALGDFPILIYGFQEPDAVRIIVHEENHRALMMVGEKDAARALDNPWSQKLVEGQRTGARYDLIHSFLKGLSASRKTEAR